MLKFMPAALPKFEKILAQETVLSFSYII